MGVFKNVVDESISYMQHKKQCMIFAIKVADRRCTCSLDFMVTRLKEVTTKIEEAVNGNRD